jgi:LPS-assembly protein
MGFGYGNLSKKGFNGAFSMGYDSQTGYLMSTVVQTTYNWDCCGVTFEYLRWNAPGATSEKMYRFGLTLSNIGTFGNLKQTQRIY